MTHKKINKVLWRVLGILPFYLFAFLPLNAQKVQVDHPEVNVGKTGFEMPVTATFQLKNKGSRHLSIVDVKTDCGCTKVDYPKKSIGGGDRFTISMTFDARQLGHFTKQAAVWFNHSEKPLWLTMKGVVVTELTDHSKNYPYAFGDLLADVNNVEFDDVKQGEHPEVEIHVLNNGGSVMTPNIQHLPPYLISMATPETLAPGRSGKVTLMLNTEHLHDFGLTQTTVYLAEQLGNRVSADTELPVSVVLLPNTTLYAGSNNINEVAYSQANMKDITQLRQEVRQLEPPVRQYHHEVVAAELAQHLQTRSARGTRLGEITRGAACYRDSLELRHALRYRLEHSRALGTVRQRI